LCTHLNDDDRIGLNVGSASRRLHPRLRNFDIRESPAVDIVGDAEAIPVEDSTFDVVVTQETLEHVRHPDVAMREIFRVLKPGGHLYCQLPFIIGYHPGPFDFLRFTKEGIHTLAENAGFQVEDAGMTVGPGYGFYRIAVEYCAIVSSAITPRVYRLAKALFAILLYPIKLTDRFLSYHPQADRIAGGYYIIARKKDR
jgi:SAM-dependent methyltransferase